MNAPTTRTSGSTEARNLRWLLENLVDEVPGIKSVAVVSSDGLLLLSSDPDLADKQAYLAPPPVPAGNGGAGEGETGKGDGVPAPGTSGTPGARAVPGEQGGGAKKGAPKKGDPKSAAKKGGPKGSSADLATIVSGVGSLTHGAAELMGCGEIKQTVVAMEEGALLVMAVSDGSLLGVHAAPDCDMSVIAYHMALFVGRAGHVLTPELRTELRKSMELDQ